MDLKWASHFWISLKMPFFPRGKYFLILGGWPALGPARGIGNLLCTGSEAEDEDEGLSTGGRDRGSLTAKSCSLSLVMTHGYALPWTGISAWVARPRASRPRATLCASSGRVLHGKTCRGLSFATGLWRVVEDRRA